MDKITAGILSKEIEAAVKAVADKHGLVATIRGGKYDSYSFTPRLTLTQKSEAGEVMTAEFRNLQSMHPDIAGKTYWVPGKGAVTVTGYCFKAHKYPILAKYPDGRTYKLTQDALKWFTPDRLAA